MSYLSYALLTEDVDFGRRSRSCITQQSNTFISDARPQIVALANALLKMEGPQTVVMLSQICAGPSFDTDVDNGDGTIDSSKVTDEDILSQCQAVYPTVAGLFYDSTGAPLTN